MSCCSNLILISPLCVLRMRGAETAHDHSAKNKYYPNHKMCRRLISCKQWPCWSTLDKVTSTKTPNSCTWAQELQQCTPCSQAGGVCVGSSGQDSSFEVTLDQTRPRLSLVSTKRKSVCLLQAVSTVQARTWSLTQLEPICNTNAQCPDNSDTRSSAPALYSAFAAIVIKLRAYCVWAENSACVYKYPFLCREIFLGFRLGVGVF